MQTQFAHQHYVSTQVGTADRLKLVVMLYDAAISSLSRAKEKMAAQDVAGKGLHLSKALDIIAELNASLNFQDGKEVAANLFHLYNFMTAHLTRANLGWDQHAVDEVIAMLTTLKEAWQEVDQKSKKPEAGAGESPEPRPHLASRLV